MAKVCGVELDDPFLAEVQLDGVTVATLTDRKFVEMFWREYRIAPVSAEAAAIIAEDALWDSCRFTFRDPKTGVVCDGGFAGGSAPFIRDGCIHLRALYFKRP